MKKIIVFLTLFVLTSHLRAQNYLSRERLDFITDSIMKEGKALYKSEWTSWYGTDVFLEKCKPMQPQSGGYLSYDNGKNLVNIFFTKGQDPKVMATITFDYGFNKAAYKLDTTLRKLNKQENDLYTIRQTAIADLNKDTLYKKYNNTELNPVPLIIGKTRKVYVLTGTQLSNVVIFGNDYLINFDDNNQIINKKVLHKNIIPINTANTPTNKSIGAVHSHLPQTGDFITATDICTLMLYEKLTTWQTHTVVSKNYISAWDCQKDQFAILTMDAWKRINANQDSLKKARGN